MADNKSITAPAGEGTPSVREEIRSSERYLRPPVDIMESEDGLTIAADMPGVAKDRLDVQIEKGVLTIKGTAEPVLKGNEVFREFEILNYYRQFQLPDALETEHVRADFVNGVLTLRLAKSERARPRRIEVRPG